jgi:GNAT superfamily N-acetyltransferase
VACMLTLVGADHADASLLDRDARHGSAGKLGDLLVACVRDGASVGLLEDLTVALMVHPAARGHGFATRLLETAEAHAAAQGRTLLSLDTETGSAAEQLYRRRGWIPVARVAGWALTPSGVLAATTFMTKALG